MTVNELRKLLEPLDGNLPVMVVGIYESEPVDVTGVAGPEGDGPIYDYVEIEYD